MLLFPRCFPDDVGGAAATIDTSIAADEQLNRESVTSPAPKSFAAAGAAFLAGLSPEQQAAPLAAGDDDDAGDVAEEGTGIDVAGEAITREDGATWKPGLNRWVDAAGTMVAGAPPEGAPAAPAAAGLPASKGKPAAAPAAGAAPADVAGSGASEKITLPGIADRGEEAIELEIDDPVVAERLRRLAKDGLRLNAYHEQRAALVADQQQLQDVTAQIESDPVGFIVRQLTPERQIAVARAVLLEHFDQLIPDIEQLASDPTARANRRVELRDSMAVSQANAESARTARAYATRVITAVEALVPDDASPTDAREFLQVARPYLASLASNGHQVTPDNVATLLAKHLKFAGFSGQPAPAASTASAARAPGVAVPVARPATDAARAIADRAASAPQAAAAAQRVRRVQTQRAAATRVAPAGAGAAPVSVPLLKPEERTDIRTASKALLKQGLPATWGANG